MRVSMDDHASLGIKRIQTPARKLQGLRNTVLRAGLSQLVPKLAYELIQCLRFVLQGIDRLIRTRWDAPGMLKRFAQQGDTPLRFQLLFLHRESERLKKQSAALGVNLEHASVALSI